MAIWGNTNTAVAVRRRTVKSQAKRQTVEPSRLRALASDPALSSGAIATAFGYTRSTFFVYLSQHEELWQVYEDARVGAGHNVGKTRLRVKRGALDGDDRKIIDAIAHGRRTVTEIAQFAEFDLHSFASRLYNLEHERHEIWSTQVGLVTRYFLREEEQGAEVGGRGSEKQTAKGRAA
jgi:hypothetical protein